MINTRFEIYKVEREIKRSGTVFEVYGLTLNEFDEPQEDAKIGEIKGLYHEVSNYIDVYAVQDVRIRTQKLPRLLVILNDIKNLDLKIGSILKHNGKSYRVTSVIDVQLWGLIGDICLELVDNEYKAEF